MSDTDNKPSETVTPGDSQTTVQTSAAPVANAVDPAEVERLRKEAEQNRMRANQLENELKKKEEAEEEAKRKRLEEQEEWKQIAEQERTKREALETERETEQRNKELNEATDKLFSDFPAEVVEIAKETGLSLNENSDEAREALKSKLTKIQSKVSSETKPTPNNPAPSGAQPQREQQLEAMRFGDRKATEDVIGNLPAVVAMRKAAGYDTNQ